MFKLALHLRSKIGSGTLLVNTVFRYILRVNKTFDFPVHYTSRISFGSRIKVLNSSGSCILYKCLGLSGGVYLQGRNGIEIDSSVHIAPGVKIISSNHDSNDLSRHLDSSKCVKIGKDVWLGANAIVLPNVSIGDNVTVGAGAVVTRDVPSNSIAIGVPAKILEKV